MGKRLALVSRNRVHIHEILLGHQDATVRTDHIDPEDIDSKYDSETAIRQIVREPICSSQAGVEEVITGQSFSMSPRSIF